MPTLLEIHFGGLLFKGKGTSYKEPRSHQPEPGSQPVHKGGANTAQPFELLSLTDPSEAPAFPLAASGKESPKLGHLLWTFFEPTSENT